MGAEAAKESTRAIVETPWLTYAEAARYLSKSVSTLQHLVSAKKVPFYGQRRSRRFRRDMLDLWLVDSSLALRKWKVELAVGKSG